jgi:uncharacterized membrane protein
MRQPISPSAISAAVLALLAGTAYAQADDRVGYYRRYGDILGVRNLGPNLDCASQLPFS